MTRTQICKTNFINGKMVKSNEKVENVNPSDTSDTIGFFDQCCDVQLSEAIESANRAQRTWSKTTSQKRHDVLMNIGQELISRSSEIGELLSREEGKPLKEGIGETYRAGQFFCFYAAQSIRLFGQTADSVRSDIEIDIRREPLGTIAVISPWNFPIATASWKIAPALAFGNSVVWKPANLTPATATTLAEIVSRQDIPAGLFNLVMGSGQTIGYSLVSSPNIDGVTFTGSVDVGRRVAQAAIKNMTKIQLEMGSKNALVVCSDADIDLAVSCAVSGAFGGTGQKCTASSRLIVEEKVFEEFQNKFVSSTKKLKVGHALDEKTEVGPVVSKSQLASNLKYVELGKSEGAEHLTGGTQLELSTEGFYMSPAVFVGTNDMIINKEEMFAPIACLIVAADFEEALDLANTTEFGLTAGIMTSSLSKSTKFRRNIRSGCVMVNLPTAGTDYHVPFGGIGASSYGSREQGQIAEEFYTSVKTAYISSL